MGSSYHPPAPNIKPLKWATYPARKNGALLFVRKTLASCTVNESLPTVTVIIAARPDMAEVRVLAPAQKLDYPADKLEIIPASVRMIDTFLRSRRNGRTAHLYPDGY
jgi:hypothetical protein